MEKSKLFSLNWRDLGRGLIMAILTPAMITIQQSIDSGTLVFKWKVIAMASIGGALAYLIKNFFTAD